MDLVEVHKGVWQLSQNDFCAAAVHQVHVVPFKRVHEAFSNAVRLRAAYRRVHRFNPKCAHQRVRFMRSIGAAVVAQEFQPGRADAGLAESCLDRFHQHVAHGLARQAASLVVLARQGRARNPLFFASELDGLLQDFCLHRFLAEHALQLGYLRARSGQFARRHHRFASSDRR